MSGFRQSRTIVSIQVYHICVLCVEPSFVVRWDPQNPDLTFFDQSAVLYAHYYYIQILVHRPFVTHHAARTSSAVAYLAICANAARSCARVMDTQTRRGRVMATPNVTASIFLEYRLERFNTSSR
jgi:hypothetical protein